jgi:CheY-like chemotaxis protein
VEEELPAVEADAAQLEQVWMNLAANARDAMPEGGTLEYRMTASPTSGGVRWLHVTVRDTGVGMSSAVAERVFDPFFTTKPRDKGTGLGLSIVHGIVEQHGGRIELETAPNRGTLFRLSFPGVVSASSKPLERVSPIMSTLRGAERILVVDDDEAVRNLTVEVLTQRGYAVRSAGSERELQVLLAEPCPGYDLLLSDVILPDMDGNQVQALVSRYMPGIACMFMTGHADDVLAPRGILREGVSLLRKPFTPDELARKVRSVLDLGASSPAASTDHFALP